MKPIGYMDGDHTMELRKDLKTSVPMYYIKTVIWNM